MHNNIFATKTVAEAPDRMKTEIFVMIFHGQGRQSHQRDGGDEKGCGELIIQSRNEISAAKFVAVRFGNVLGSQGSVISY